MADSLDPSQVLVEGLLKGGRGQAAWNKLSKSSKFQVIQYVSLFVCVCVVRVLVCKL